MREKHGLAVTSAAVSAILVGVFSQFLPAENWVETLPEAVRESIVWTADHEEGSLADWTFPEFQYPGGGVFNTGGADVEATAARQFAHSGDWSARTTISNAVRARHGNRAVRLMRWTDTAWDNGGQYFPDAMYYSTWLRFPHTYNPNKYAPWDPGDGGWWNVFQFKGDDVHGASQPLWTLNVEHADDTQEMHFYLYSKYNPPHSYEQVDPAAIPIDEWLHLEAFYRSRTDGSGRIAIWQNGRLILDVRDVVTSLGGETGADLHPIWGIGNYTDHIAGAPVGEGAATIYFDDAVVSSLPTSNLPSGDYNSDGIVTAADYLAWRNAVGSPVANPFEGADGDGSGLIDEGDYDVWKMNFGLIAAASLSFSASTPLPEPSSACLLLYASAGVCLRGCWAIGSASSSPGGD